MQPGSARAYQILGDIYSRADQPDEAVLNYRKALEIDPGNVRVRLGLGEVLIDAKKPEQAFTEAETVLGADAQNRFALDLKTRSLRDLRRFDEADAAADLLIATFEPGLRQRWAPVARSTATSAAKPTSKAKSKGNSK